MKIEDRIHSEIIADLAQTLNATQPPIMPQGSEIPSCQSIARITSLLKQLMFPGYCDSESPSESRSWDSLESYLGTRLEDLASRLSSQIAIAMHLNHNDKDSLADDDQIRVQTGELTAKFIQRIPEIRRKLGGDVQAAFDGDPACKNFSEVVLCYPGLQAVFIHRVAHELYQLDVPFLPRMLAEWVHGETGIDIHPGATIGEHFFIDHGTGVVIGQTCIIGQHVKIYQGVTLGALSFPTDGSGALVRNTKRHPTIEDNVVIYANATVLGGNTVVGHDSVIGSSVWLTRSVDPFTTVVMEKPKLQLRNQTPSDFEPPLDYQI